MPLARHTLPRTHPRISAAKLGEYLIAGPTRRRGIIRDQRAPRVPIVKRYDEARNFLRGYLARPAPDRALVNRAIERLRSRSSSTQGESDQYRDSSDALVAFLLFPEDFESRLPGATRPLSTPQTLLIGGVRVSIAPDLEFVPPPRRGVPAAGAVKLYFGKTYPLVEQSAEAVAALVQRELRERRPAKVKVHPRDCLVVDVFTATITEAPARSIRLMRDLENACEEIAGLWERP